MTNADYEVLKNIALKYNITIVCGDRVVGSLIINEDALFNINPDNKKHLEAEPNGLYHGPETT